MRQFIKSLLEFCLTTIAEAVLRRYKPTIVGVTGNVGKTTTKEAIATVIRKIRSVRVNAGNLNNELGLPMTIIGDWSGEYYEKGSGLWLWIRVILTGLRMIVLKSEYPEVLVLEYAADHPGDIKKLCSRFRPHISVITEVGDIPVHVEYFGNKNAVAREKAELVRILDINDYAVLNYDNDLVHEMRRVTHATIKSYGSSDKSSIRISNYGYHYGIGGVDGISFKINEGGSILPVSIRNSLGESVALSAAAASAVGRILNMNLDQIGEALMDYRGLPGRLKLLKGIKNTQIIDDTYNASPSATKLALKVLKDIQCDKRKIAVLGDMLELGDYTEMAHVEIGKLAGEFCDYLICVGNRSIFTADAASKIMSSDKIHRFDTPAEAGKLVQDLIQDGDLILVKGSQGIRMEKVVEEIMADPGKKFRLLVRQSKKWLEK